MDRQFKGVWIPAEVWLDNRLTLVEKALLAEIDSFTGNGKTFHKCNDTIQTEYGISRNTISRALRKLEALDFIDVNFNGRTRHCSIRAGSIPKMGRQSPQNGEAASPNDTSTNTDKRTIDNTSKLEVVLPWESERFVETWDAWKEYKRDEFGFRFKSPKSEQISLHQLQKYSGGNEDLAIQMIHETIAKGWRGIPEPKIKRNAKSTSRGVADGSLIEAHLRKLANESGESLG